jgi:EmrB/QacA subfamily drug resistance transporter
VSTATRKQLTLVACILGSAVATVDGTVVNVALPAIQRDLGGGLADQQWIVNAYLLTLSSLILIGGSLSDIFGERRVFAAGALGFGVVSIGCAAAPTIQVLIAMRALQGVAGALLVPSSLAVIVATFKDHERGAAIGAWTAWGGIATVIGPLGGGWIVDHSTWRWIFIVNVPLVAATLVLVYLVVPDHPPADSRRRVDVVGAVLCALGLGGPVFALIHEPSVGWTDATVLVPLIGGVAVFAAFVAWEARTPQPMLPLGLFRRRNFAVGNLQTVTMYAGLGILIFLLVIYLQGAGGGFTALQSGLTLLPVTIIVFLLSRRFGALADRRGPRWFMAGGGAVAALGTVLFLMVGTDPSYVPDLLVPVCVFGLGLAMTVAPLTAAVLADADVDNAGIASAVNNAVARAAGLVGVAIIGIVVSSQYASELDSQLAAAGVSTTSPPAAASVVQEAKARPLATINVSSMPASEQPAMSSAIATASTSAFHVGCVVSALLLLVGAITAAIGIRDPRRLVRAELCPGGSLAGAPRALAGQASEAA